MDLLTKANGPFSQLVNTISRVHPLWYMLIYIAAIPAFGLLYAFGAPHGFYAPYARYEPGGVSDAVQLASSLEGALQRSLGANADREFLIGNWKLDLRSLRVDEVKSNDGSEVSFRIRFSANGVGMLSGASQVGWSAVITVPERPTSAVLLGQNKLLTYRFPDVDFSGYASPFRESNAELFKLVFAEQEYAHERSAPALALISQEEMQFNRYLQGIKGDSSAVSGHTWRMIYVSAVVITTLGLGDIVPVSMEARFLIAAEAIFGIILAGFFLNALAYRASHR